MRSVLKIFLVCGLASVLWLGDATAGTSKLNVQGVLRNTAGEAVSGTYNIKFTLYDAQTGGNELYTETQALTVTGGVFNTYLGPVNENVFINNSEVWVGIKVGSDPELPRRPITPVGFAVQSSHADEADTLLGAATDLQCTECVGDGDISVNYALGVTKGGDAAGLQCSGCVQSSDIQDGTILSADIGDGEVKTADIAANAVSTAKLQNDAVDSSKLRDDPTGVSGAVGTNHIQNKAVTTAKLADGAVTSTQVNFNYANSTSKGGDAIGLTCATACVSSGEVDFNYAGSTSKGGPATDVSCPTTQCIDSTEVSFNYAGSASKGGAASDLNCGHCVSESEVSFAYANSTGPAGPAVDLVCTGCVQDADLGINYAASASGKGGPAANVQCSGCIQPVELSFYYDASSSKGGPATDVQCTKCIDTADIGLGQVLDGNIGGTISGTKITKATTTAVGVVKIGTGLQVDGNALLSVRFGTTADTVAAGNHTHAGMISDGGPYNLDPGQRFTFRDGGDSDYAYFLNPTTFNDNQIAMRLVLGDDWDESERFEIYTQSSTFTGVTHRMAANGNAYHKGNVQLDGSLVCTNCVSDGNISGLSGSKVTNLPGGNIQANTSINLDQGDITARYIYAYRYYDRDNTGYYAEPAATSRFNRIDYTDLYFAGNSNYGFAGSNVYADTVNTGSANDPLEIQYYHCGDVRMFWGSCGDQYLDVNGYMRVKTMYDRDNTSYYINPAGNSQVSSIYANSWFRAQGNSGFYFQDRGGGWNMTDSTWIRAYNNKGVLVNNDVRANRFVDNNDTGYYVDPNSTSMIRKLSVNDGATACCASYYTVSINEGGGQRPTLQFHDSGVAEGQIVLYGDLGEGAGRGFRFQSSQQTMSGRFTNNLVVDGHIRTQYIYDRNNTCFQLDWNGDTRMHVLGANYINATTSLRANNAYISRLWTDWPGFGGNSNFYGDVVPGYNNAYTVGHYAGGGSYQHAGWRSWYAMSSYRFWTASSERLKHDIRDLDDRDLQWALDSLRNIRTAFYWYNGEYASRDEAEQAADRFLQSRAEEMRKSGSGDEPPEFPREVAVQRRHRPVPHIGIIAESLPPELWVEGSIDKGYNIPDAIGLLFATNKALDKENQELRQDVLDLEDRVALLEQALVDAGILR